MSTPEQRLADLLRAEAEALQPTGEGLRHIQQRVARRRRSRLLVLPGAALATAAAVAGVLVLSGGGGDDSLQQIPGASVTRTPSSTPTGAPSQAPRPSGTVAPPPATPSPEAPAAQPFVPAIWPFASHDQAQVWRAAQAARPWAASNLGVAQHFVSDYLHLTGVHVRQSCASCDVVTIVGSGGSDVATVGLVREDDGVPRAYSVAGVYPLSGFTVRSPASGQAISSPATVSGTIVGVDESITIDLITQSGRTIAHAATPAGSGAPWSTTISWSDTQWYTGALVLRTYSPKDGALNRLVVLRVTRA